jgi:hypothetical protein
MENRAELSAGQELNHHVRRLKAFKGKNILLKQQKAG